MDDSLPDTPVNSSAEYVRARLIGAWRLISWTEDAPTGKVAYPLGEDATGQIIYSADGRVAAQLQRSGIPRFADDDWRKATPDERATAWLGYFGYFGTFAIDERRKAVIHRIEGSWFPNLNGSEQVRFYRFEGDQLVLDADTAWGKVRIIWEKV